jgi:hypothetical protein
MLVKVLNFGTNWWARLGHDLEDPERYFRHAAYYNSTGVRCGSKIRRHWIVPGLVRFNGVDGFNPGAAGDAIGITFVCSDLTHAFGGNRLLFKSRAARAAVPDRYLVVVSSGIYGRIDFASKVWKSALSGLIAVSQLRLTQEAMLLMNPGDWIQTCNGFWQLSVPDDPRESARLQRIGERISA